MNRQKVQQEITNIIEAYRRQISYARQHNPSKKWLAEAEQLGIADLLPSDIGNSDIQQVLKAAKQSQSAVFNAYGEGEAVAASALWLALNKADEPTVPEGSYSIVEVERYDNEAADADEEGYVTRYAVDGIICLDGAEYDLEHIVYFVTEAEAIKHAENFIRQFEGMAADHAEMSQLEYEYAISLEREIAEGYATKATVQIAFRTTEKQADEISDYLERTGIDQSEMIRRAIAAYIQADVPQIKKGGAR